jgi:hypothetical protein
VTDTGIAQSGVIDVDAVHPGSSLAASLEGAGIHFTTDPACAVPAGRDPTDLDWCDGEDGQLEQRLTWVSLASEWGIAAASVVRLGVVWSFGGRAAGAGRYVRDAYLYAEADSVGLGQTFRAIGGFESTHNTRGEQIAEVSATVQLDHFYLRGLEGTYMFDIQVRGDGSGEIRPRNGE